MVSTGSSWSNRATTPNRGESCDRTRTDGRRPGRSAAGVAAGAAVVRGQGPADHGGAAGHDHGAAGRQSDAAARRRRGRTTRPARRLPVTDRQPARRCRSTSVPAGSAPSTASRVTRPAATRTSPTFCWTCWPTGRTVGDLKFEREPDVELTGGLRARPITSEQSNTSLVFGNQYILKLFRRLTPGVNPDLLLHRALRERRQRAHRRCRWARSPVRCRAGRRRSACCSSSSPTRWTAGPWPPPACGT